VAKAVHTARLAVGARKLPLPGIRFAWRDAAR
jgi:hypothetical protein